MSMQVDFLAKTNLRYFPSDVSLSLKTQANLPCQTLHLPVLKAQNVVALVLLVTDILSKSSTSMLPFHISLLSSVSKRIVLSLPLIKIQSYQDLCLRGFIVQGYICAYDFDLAEAQHIIDSVGWIYIVMHVRPFRHRVVRECISKKYYTLFGVFIRGRHFEFDPTVINQLFLTPHVRPFCSRVVRECISKQVLYFVWCVHQGVPF
ncbi:hypothetical protein Bca4012_032081 [Brassica carinata]|uniref:Uncharacterized protein n=1 Tax=Brassica carinata TaxID=52824 RepID=A0A8X7RG89_BRACI|nr:hypothetical protein Bca52824_046866 [Brassica carinata]